MSRKLHNILITGGAGFIGSNFIHYLFGLSTAKNGLFSDADFNGTVVNVDCLTYAGNLESLSDVEEKYGKAAGKNQRYFFEKVDICDRAEIERIFKQYDIDTVVHFAAESHVDRSILGPEAFVKTNVMGTFTMLDVARNYWKKKTEASGMTFFSIIFLQMKFMVLLVRQVISVRTLLMTLEALTHLQRHLQITL